MISDSSSNLLPFNSKFFKFGNLDSTTSFNNSKAFVSNSLYCNFNCSKFSKTEPWWKASTNFMEPIGFNKQSLTFNSFNWVQLFKLSAKTMADLEVMVLSCKSKMVKALLNFKPCKINLAIPCGLIPF
ncbi:hypothetical protein WICPIJ_006094 [Wickerhamomyces pijperi]|uniref:Uncharacterized protein n=1 Tax=Wickerhamomyces pijperi TaxID=599730 RepID=A0A9P8TLC4_WICPI|nr:hypothetical protein WICPIJ_006094 [Wickerhamomyces pijperi]